MELNGTRSNHRVGSPLMDYIPKLSRRVRFGKENRKRVSIQLPINNNSWVASKCFKRSTSPGASHGQSLDADDHPDFEVECRVLGINAFNNDPFHFYHQTPTVDPAFSSESAGALCCFLDALVIRENHDPLDFVDSLCESPLSIGL